jgi:hypothetical protein
LKSTCYETGEARSKRIAEVAVEVGETEEQGQEHTWFDAL